MSAIYTGALNVIGAGVGPVAVGYISDVHVETGPIGKLWSDPIGFALAVVVLTSGIISVVLFAFAAALFTNREEENRSENNK